MILWDDNEWMEMVPETLYEGSWMETHLVEEGLLQYELIRTTCPEPGESPVFLRIRKANVKK